MMCIYVSVAVKVVSGPTIRIGTSWANFVQKNLSVCVGQDNH